MRNILNTSRDLLHNITRCLSRGQVPRQPGHTTGKPPSVSGGRCWLKSEQQSFVLYRRNTYEQCGGYNLFHNPAVKANFSIKVWRNVNWVMCHVFFAVPCCFKRYHREMNIWPRRLVLKNDTSFSCRSLFKTWPKPETAHEKPLEPRVL